MKLFLIRHAEAIKIEKDTILTRKGKKQAHSLALYLSTLPVHRVFVSTATRTQETYDAYHTLKPKIPAVHTSQITEIYRTLIGGPSKKGTPINREKEDKLRIDSFLTNLTSQAKYDNIALFTHGNVIRYCFARALHLDREELWEKLIIHPASLSLIEIHTNKWYVKMINCIEHLPKKERQEFYGKDFKPTKVCS